MAQPNLQDIVANAVRQGIAAGLQHQSKRASLAASELHLEHADILADPEAYSPARSQHSHSPPSEEEK